MVEADVCCVYGGSLTDIYRRFQEWLSEKEGRYLVFLQEEWDSVLDLSLDARIRVVPSDQEELFKQVVWEFVFLRFAYVDEENSARSRERLARLQHLQSGVHLVASDYSDMGERVLTNVFKHARRSAPLRLGQELFGAFSGVPAIICGAGPSLAKNRDFLKGLDQRALLFAGGSALNALSVEGIVPHFSASIDPDPSYRRFYEQTAFEVPFFYQSRLAHRLLDVVQGPLLWMADSGGYPIEQWLNERMGLKSPSFDGGWNAATFCIALAEALGCGPIILVGMDLACPDQHLYAPGVQQEKREERLIEVQDQAGHLLYSKPDWVMAARWIEEFATEHPGCRWINATEGGLGFQGIEPMPLRSAIDAHLARTFDLRGWVHARLQRIPPSQGSGEEGWIRIEESLERCAEKIDQLLGWIEKLYPNPPHEKGEVALLECDLEEELACQKMLDPLWAIWKHVFQRQTADPSGMFLNKLLFFKRVIACVLNGMKS